MNYVKFKYLHWQLPEFFVADFLFQITNKGVRLGDLEEVLKPFHVLQDHGLDKA